MSRESNKIDSAFVDGQSGKQKYTDQLQLKYIQELEANLENIRRFNEAAKEFGMGSYYELLKNKQELLAAIDMLLEEGAYKPVTTVEVQSAQGVERERMNEQSMNEQKERDFIASNQLWHNRKVWRGINGYFPDKEGEESIHLIADSVNGHPALWEGGGGDGSGDGNAVVIAGSNGGKKKFVREFITELSVNREHAQFLVKEDDLVIFSHERLTDPGSYEYTNVYVIKGIQDGQIELQLLIQDKTYDKTVEQYTLQEC